MRIRLVTVVLSLMVFVTTGVCSAADIDNALNSARKAGKAVMLELGSVGCIPCEQMKPVIKKLRTDFKGRLEVFFVDIREDEDTASRFGVFAIPTQVFLDRNGKEFHRHIGFYAYREIVPVLKKAGL